MAETGSELSVVAETPSLEMTSADPDTTVEPVTNMRITSKPEKEEKKDEKAEKSSKDENKEDSDNSKGDKKGTKSTTKKSKNKNSSRSPKQTVAPTNEPSVEPASATIPPAAEKPSATDAPQEQACSLTITCRAVFDHMDKLSEQVKRVIPKDGMLLQGRFSVQKGDTVFDVLKRACGQHNILLDYVFTPMYSTYYIKGIGNLYEFDCGAESGWLYEVDGKSPGVGCSQYVLTGGEEIVFHYTCEK